MKTPVCVKWMGVLASGLLALYCGSRLAQGGPYCYICDFGHQPDECGTCQTVTCALCSDQQGGGRTPHCSGVNYRQCEALYHWWIRLGSGCVVDVQEVYCWVDYTCNVPLGCNGPCFKGSATGNHSAVAFWDMRCSGPCGG